MPQQPTPAVAPVAPVPPAVPPVQFPAGSPAAEVFGAQPLVGVPTTAREMRALRARRTELSSQLNSAADRRQSLVRQLERSTEATRPGLEQRIQLLDQRILQLEADIARTGQQVVAAPSELLTTSQPPRSFPVNNMRMNYTAISIVFTLAVLMPIAIAMARLIWKRTTAPVPRAPSAEDRERLVRLEQAIDTIAVEVERISEGQRYVTQLMADGARPVRALEHASVSGRQG